MPSFHVFLYADYIPRTSPTRISTGENPLDTLQHWDSEHEKKEREVLHEARTYGRLRPSPQTGDFSLSIHQAGTTFSLREISNG